MEVKVNKGKSIPVTGRGGPEGCETSRFPHFLDERMAVRSSALRAGRPLPPRRFLVLISVRGCSAAGRIRPTEKSISLIGNRTRYLPVCSIVSQATMLPRAPEV
jgi:hypothetical protein